MPVVVTLTLNEKTVLVEADKVEKDPYLDANLLLFGTRGLSLPAPDGAPFITTVWSVPKAQVKFYAVGRREPAVPPSQPAPAVAPPEAEVKLVAEMPDFVREAGAVLARERGEVPPEVPPEVPLEVPPEVPPPAPKNRGGRKKKPLPEDEVPETSA
jgi:hypothetical protein